MNNVKKFTTAAFKDQPIIRQQAVARLVKAVEVFGRFLDQHDWLVPDLNITVGQVKIQVTFKRLKKAKTP